MEQQLGYTPEQTPIHEQEDQVAAETTTDAANTPAQVSRLDLTQPFSWQATEGVVHQRNSMWYIAFAIVVLGLMALAIFVFNSITFATLLPVMATAVIILSTKQVRTITYSVSPKGVYVADKLYDFSEFRAFGVIQDPEYASILLLPVKRFSPGVTLYFDEKDGEQIVDMLGARLPIKEVKIDALEKFIRFIRL